MNTGDWIFYYTIRAVEWLNPIVCFIGLVISIWAFRRCRKCGYFIIAIYFAFSVFTLVALPAINRAIRAHRPPDYSAQTQQKIDAAVKDAVQKVLAEDGYSHGVPQKRTIHFPFGSIILVVGLWLLAKREPQNQVEKVTRDTAPNDEKSLT
jgi:hypothetical protein